MNPCLFRQDSCELKLGEMYPLIGGLSEELLYKFFSYFLDSVIVLKYIWISEWLLKLTILLRILTFALRLLCNKNSVSEVLEDRTFVIPEILLTVIVRKNCNLHFLRLSIILTALLTICRTQKDKNNFISSVTVYDEWILNNVPIQYTSILLIFCLLCLYPKNF